MNNDTRKEVTLNNQQMLNRDAALKKVMVRFQAQKGGFNMNEAFLQEIAADANEEGYIRRFASRLLEAKVALKHKHISAIPPISYKHAPFGDLPEHGE